VTDRCTVTEWRDRHAQEPQGTLAWFVEGVLAVEREAPRAPRRFRPFEWRRQLEAACRAARAQCIRVP